MSASAQGRRIRGEGRIAKQALLVVAAAISVLPVLFMVLTAAKTLASQRSIRMGISRHQSSGAALRASRHRR